MRTAASSGIGGDAAAGFDAVESRHLHVHQHDVWPSVPRQLDGRSAVGRLADDFQAAA
jgi:hypothetical protein